MRAGEAQVARLGWASRPSSPPGYWFSNYFHQRAFEILKLDPGGRWVAWNPCNWLPAKRSLLQTRGVRDTSVAVVLAWATAAFSGCNVHVRSLDLVFWCLQWCGAIRTPCPRCNWVQDSW